jgi:excinuclease UvrABC ATPase subunit
MNTSEHEAIDEQTVTNEQNAINALNNAAGAYNRALQQAWERASLDAHKAANELNANQQRITLDARTRHSAVYQDWYDAVQAGADQTDPAQHAEKANLTYRDAVTEVNKEGQSNWQQSCQAYQDAATAVNEAYTNATKEALLAYLAEIKGIWSAADPQQFDAATLAKLAEATSYAAGAVGTVLQRQA